MRLPFFGRSVSGKKRRTWSIEALEIRDMMSTIPSIGSKVPPGDHNRLPPIVWNPPQPGPVSSAATR